MRAVLWGLLVCLFAIACRSTPPTDPGRSIVLVTLDTVRADHLASYGYPTQTSPFIDSLAAQGVRFANAYTSCSHTAPAHASMFTGLHPVQHLLRANGQPMNPAFRTLAEVFRDLGFQTGAFTSVRFLSSVNEGFEVTRHESCNALYCPGDHTINLALDWLKTVDASRRFFLWVHLYDPHQKQNARSSYIDQIKDQQGTPTIDPLGFFVQSHGIPLNAYRDRQRLLGAMTRYDAQIRFADDQLRRLYAFMDDKGLNRNALWIVTADHGEGLGNHGYKGHGKYIYNEQLRVPLIFHSTAGDLNARVVPEPVQHVDLFPTLSELERFPASPTPLTLPGISLVSALKGIAPLPTRPIYAERRARSDRDTISRDWETGDIYALQSGAFKYIVHSQGNDELFNLEADRFELTNLASTPSPDRDRMRALAVAHYEQLRANTLKVKELPLKEEFMDELKALGYVQ